MSALNELTSQVAAANNLTDPEIVAAVVALSGTVETDEAKAAFLVALAKKGESADELAGKTIGLDRPVQPANRLRIGMAVADEGAITVGSHDRPAVTLSG